MIVFVKKLFDGVNIPVTAFDNDAGVDVEAFWFEETDKYIEYGTGLSVQIDQSKDGEWFLQCFPRSSVSNYDLILCNSVGVIDGSYTGEIKLRFKKTKENGKYYNVGDRVAQLILARRPKIEFVEVEELSKTNRGSGGFGHSGN